jgi:hypothetical protein
LPSKSSKSGLSSFATALLYYGSTKTLNKGKRKLNSSHRKPDASTYQLSGCLEVRYVNDSAIISTSIYNNLGVKTHAYTKIIGIDSVRFAHDIIINDFVQPHY